MENTELKDRNIPQQIVSRFFELLSEDSRFTDQTLIQLKTLAQGKLIFKSSKILEILNNAENTGGK